MTEKYHGQKWHGDDDESTSMPDESPVHDESVPSVSYGYVGHGHVPSGYKIHKKAKMVYDPGYMAVKHKSKHYACPPIVCDPQYVFHDYCIPREVPVIHPIIHVHRHNIVNVPKHYYQSSSKNVVVDPGCPGKP